MTKSEGDLHTVLLFFAIFSSEFQGNGGILGLMLRDDSHQFDKSVDEF